jgi:hypothetical protein
MQLSDKPKTGLLNDTMCGLRTPIFTVKKQDVKCVVESQSGFKRELNSTTKFKRFESD